MKRIIIIIAAIMALSNFATAQKYYNKVKLVTSEDSVSYCIGFLMAKNFAEQDWNFVKTDALAKAFSDVTNNKTSTESNRSRTKKPRMPKKNSSPPTRKTPTSW